MYFVAGIKVKFYSGIAKKRLVAKCLYHRILMMQMVMICYDTVEIWGVCAWMEPFYNY